MSHYCPKCERILYSRRLILCGFCGAEISEDLRFTPEKIAQLDQELVELEAQRQEARDRAQEAAKRRTESGGDSFMGM
jgi:50S ribosomal subunit-associated GTPase HflX